MEYYKVFSSFPLLLLLVALLLLLFNPTAVMCRNLATGAGDDDELRTYIIHVQPPEHDALTSTDGLESWYSSFLPEATAGSAESPRIVYTYGEVFSGFAARLTAAEVEHIKKKKKGGFVRVYPDRRLPLLTTRTPDFLGLHVGSGLWNASALGSGVIIGVLDTGVRAGHPSFNDDQVPPPPAKWKGPCSFEKGCNNKLIGSRSFTNHTPVIDWKGHGTHTASTAAGNFVKDVSFFGLAKGTAAGTAPRAHLAIYQVCHALGCETSAVLAGMDAAVKDGVDVMSLSLGSRSQPYDHDPVAIAAFGATEKGVVVVCAAGNAGPAPATLSNQAPWVLTVAASTMDRAIRSTVKLGDGQEFVGETLYQPPNTPATMLPLYYPAGGFCLDPLEQKNFTGKVVVCFRNESRFVPGSQLGADVKLAGAVGMILTSGNLQGYTILDEAHVFPASNLADVDGPKIVSYVKSTEKPTASITFNGTVLGVSPAPVVAFFSSRGPSTLSPGILKPDITGPGVNVLAAWPFKSGGEDTGGKTFKVVSGTSMSTPHLSGIAALVKSLHPDWSPAAVKSAIMTTSDAEDRDGRPILDELHHNASFFAMGAGHVNASRAANPGLVYDLDADSYISYLCGRGLGDPVVGAIVRRPRFSCSGVRSIAEAELNYPSILVAPGSGTVTANRTVTNVGRANSTYRVEVHLPDEVSVSVEPETLDFSELNQKRSFTVTVGWRRRTKGVVQGNLMWVSDDLVVRSPIVVSSGQD